LAIGVASPIRSAAPWNREAFANEQAEARKDMTMGKSVMGQVRRSARY
jgi:hypothetical protein